LNAIDLGLILVVLSTFSSEFTSLHIHFIIALTMSLQFLSQVLGVRLIVFIEYGSLSAVKDLVLSTRGVGDAMDQVVQVA
jgi:hypothetical protein